MTMFRISAGATVLLAALASLPVLEPQGEERTFQVGITGSAPIATMNDPAVRTLILQLAEHRSSNRKPPD
jgi:hypothetical protein